MSSQWKIRASQVNYTSPSFRQSLVHAQSYPFDPSPFPRTTQLIPSIFGFIFAQTPQPQSQLRPSSFPSHSSPISTLGMLINDFPLVNLLLVPWQGKLFSRAFAVTFPFNFADALASFAFAVFGEFN